MSTVKTSSRSPLFLVIMTLTLAMVGVVAFVYVAMQQVYRQNANDPQIQLAADIAAQMSAGSLPQDAVNTNVLSVDPSKSLAPFAVVVDAHGSVTASTMKMDGTTPLPPKGVRNAASLTHQNRITWQPQAETRIALVVQAYKHDANTGYVLVGRSLKEVEVREDMLFWMSAVTAMGVVLLGGFAAFGVARKR